jgi:predicted nucleotidyltransferase component of viral defense system
MNAHEGVYLHHHRDADLFTEAIAFTAARFGFVPALIEKDYFCSAVLAYLSGASHQTLVFKGGTCLAKVHAGFYRLSEDLDFAIPMAVDARRVERSRKIEPVRQVLTDLFHALPELHEEEALTGANSSMQYIGTLSYKSLLQHSRETIKIEISLREPLLQPARPHDAATILMNPLSQRSLVPPIQFACITKQEAFAEKFRAAMTRREPAIRDYFDIDYAVGKGEIDLKDASWLQMVRKKLQVPGNNAGDVSERRLHVLRNQLEPLLKPVLRIREFQAFDLDRAFRIVADVSARIETTHS